MDYFVALSALVTIAWAEPVNAQQVRAGVLTCDVSEGMGYIIGSQKLLSCSFSPEGAGRREDYDGLIGYDFLRYFNVVFDYRDSLIYLEPNATFKRNASR